MQRKNKAMLAAAIGMVAISRRARRRCAAPSRIPRASARHRPSRGLGRAARRAGGPGDGDRSRGQGARTRQAAVAARKLRGSAWTAARRLGQDARRSATGSFVESRRGLRLDAPRSRSEAVEGLRAAQRWLNVLLLKDGDAAGRSASIVLDERRRASHSVACDGFSLFRKHTSGRRCRGTDGRGDRARRALPGLIGGQRTTELAAAIAEWAAGHAPTATERLLRRGGFRRHRAAGASAPRSIWTTTPRRSSPRCTGPARSPSSVRGRRR